MIIEDGKGSGVKAEVNAENELVVRAITEPEIEHASGKLGTAYSWDSTELNLTAGETFLYVQNTGSVPLRHRPLIIVVSKPIADSRR